MFFLKNIIASWTALSLCWITCSEPSGLITKPWFVPGYSRNVPRPFEVNSFSNSFRSSGVKRESFSAHKKRIGRFICLASSLTKNDGCAATPAFTDDENSGWVNKWTTTLAP